MEAAHTDSLLHHISDGLCSLFGGIRASQPTHPHQYQVHNSAIEAHTTSNLWTHCGRALSAVHTSTQPSSCTMANQQLRVRSYSSKPRPLCHPAPVIPQPCHTTVHCCDTQGVINFCPAEEGVPNMPGCPSHVQGLPGTCPSPVLAAPEQASGSALARSLPGSTNLGRTVHASD